MRLAKDSRYSANDLLPPFSQYDSASPEEKQFEFEVAQALRLNLLNQSGFDSLGVESRKTQKAF